MSIVADHYRTVVGVDTHAATHTYAVVESPSGKLLDQKTFPTTPAGLASGTASGCGARAADAAEVARRFGAAERRGDAVAGYRSSERSHRAKSPHG
ncbi:hypothetical protein [Cryobacterium sp. Y62]|uniref:hypothetical protein n=1 Tax=Cryobacterium sp. Y62 TaxID=2048284 RepID=UPI000CE53B8B|nr:hypothetical protein [Cryobacterium sp. Y62]